MQGAGERFLLFVVLERDRHIRRLRLPSLTAVLIGVLLYQTQWLILRPGLTILLAGQVGVVVALLLRSTALSEDLNRLNAGVLNQEAVRAWFEKEEAFARRLALFESGCQAIGFIALGYAFWVTTQSYFLALMIGIVYPATVYFGITRRRNLRMFKQIRAEKQDYGA
jgi:hypothetical protein